MRSYRELSRLPSIQERYEYLYLGDFVGRETFGYDRYLNQMFYRSAEWKELRNKIIIRDGGNDLGVQGYPVFRRGMVHHMNPIKMEQLIDADPSVLDPDQLILCSLSMHNAIHFGTPDGYKQHILIERKPGDTKLW